VRQGLAILSSVLLLSEPTALAQSSKLNSLQGEQGDQNAEGPPIIFYADLSADEESAETDSPGAGRFECSLERKTLMLSWTVTYKDLTSPATSAAIHGPQTPGGEAGVLIDLAPKGVASPITGSVVLNEGELEYLLTGRMYVNIDTKQYPAGELRGQLSRQRPLKQGS
jgi:hypothetical protein